MKGKVEEVKEQMKNRVKEQPKKLVGMMEERKITAEEHEVSHTTGK